MLDEVEESTNTFINISEQEKPFVIEDKKEDMYNKLKCVMKCVSEENNICSYKSAC